MKFLYLSIAAVFIAVNANAQLVEESVSTEGAALTEAVDSSSLSGTWSLFGWSCGDDKANEATVEVDHHESLIAVTFVGSSCEKDQSIVGKLYMTGWVYPDSDQILFQRVSYHSRTGLAKDSSLKFARIFEGNRIIAMYPQRYTGKKMLMIRRTQQ